MNAMKIAFSYFTVVGMPIAAFYGTVMNNLYALNITVFMCWLAAILATLILPTIISDDQKARAIRKAMSDAKKVPHWIDYVCDIAVLILLVAHGMFLLSSIWVYQLILMVVLHGRQIEENSNA